MGKLLIGLGAAAVLTVGLMAGIIAASNHPHLSEPLQLTLTDR